MLPIDDWALYPLEARFPKPQQLPSVVRGIVVLGGGEDRRATMAWGEPTLYGDFGSLLEGQLRSWEKRWFAQGHYGPHASQQRLELLSRAARVQQQLAGMSRDWRRNRYFFPDYSFEFGAVPDFLVAKLLESPNLFRPLTPEEVKEREENAVEGNQWALINKADAMKFMETFRLSKAVERDIVFLGK